MDKWDKKEESKDELISMIKDLLPKYMENMNKPQKHRVTLFLDDKQLKKVSEALN